MLTGRGPVRLQTLHYRLQGIRLQAYTVYNRLSSLLFNPTLFKITFIRLFLIVACWSFFTAGAAPLSLTPLPGLRRVANTTTVVTTHFALILL